MGGRDHSCEGCGRGGFNDPNGSCECGTSQDRLHPANLDVQLVGRPGCAFVSICDYLDLWERYTGEVISEPLEQGLPELEVAEADDKAEESKFGAAASLPSNIDRLGTTSEQK